jgi:phosphoglycerate dehydrogenase-like enzyme
VKPRVIVAPAFRQMSEIFDPISLQRLNELAEVRWGRDGAMPVEEFDVAMQEATAVVFGTWHYGRDSVAAAGPSLRHIFEVAGSFRHPDLNYPACFERDITVGSCAPAFGPVVAEMALALSLAAARLVTEGDAAFRRGDEPWLHAGNESAISLFGKTFGFVGAGGLSRHLQPLLKPFGGRFLAYDPWLDTSDLRERSIEPTDLETLFRASDVVYVLAVPSPDNRHLVSRRLMELLEPDAILAIISRAHLVDFDAMTQLVLQGRFRVAVDVFPQEPLAPDHPIRNAGGSGPERSSCGCTSRGSAADRPHGR